MGCKWVSRFKQIHVKKSEAAGASRIIAIDVSKERLEKAKEVGATHIINSLEENPTEIIILFMVG